VSGAGASRDPFSNPGTQVDPFASDPFGGEGGRVTPTPAAPHNDPFSSSSGAFADFANFDSKVRLVSCAVILNCGSECWLSEFLFYKSQQKYVF
jgi:hypothetical protein